MFLVDLRCQYIFGIRLCTIYRMFPGYEKRSCKRHAMQSIMLHMMKVKTTTLLAIAGFFWLIAGVNVDIVGVRAYQVAATSPLVLAALIAGTVVIFLLFFLRIFRPYAGKHERRIDAMTQDRVSAFQFMDRKGYIMIIFMIALGAGLRLSGFVPDWFIAFFYVGLGTALALTGVLFLIGWRKRAQG